MMEANPRVGDTVQPYNENQKEAIVSKPLSHDQILQWMITNDGGM